MKRIYKPYRKRTMLFACLLVLCLLVQTACTSVDGTTNPEENTETGILGDAAQSVGQSPALSGVETRTEEVAYVIPFAVTYTYSDKYADGEQVLLSEGEDGVFMRSYQVTVVDGVETDRTLVTETVRAEAHPQVIVIGTRKLPSTAPTGTFRWPTVSRRITSYYGRRWLSGKSDFHYGIDIAGGVGANTYATDGGTVIYAGKTYGANASYGNLIIVDHGNGYTSYYAHLSRVLVAKGDKVYQGQLIGLVGATGNVTGPHLHFEIRKNGITKNPLSYVSP